jgi:hypothetical protein
MASLMAQMGQGGGAGAPGGGEGGEGGASNIDFEALMKQASRFPCTPLLLADIAQIDRWVRTREEARPTLVEMMTTRKRTRRLPARASKIKDIDHERPVIQRSLVVSWKRAKRAQ